MRMPYWLVRWLHRRHLSRRRLRGGWLHRVVGDRLLSKDLWRPSRESVARAWLIGFPITMVPFLPIQSLFACSIGVFFRANLLFCLLLQFLSTPLTAPVHLPACYLVGRALEGDSPVSVWRQVRKTDWTQVSSFKLRDLRALYTGAITLGAIGGIAGYFIILSFPDRRRLPSEPGNGPPPTTTVA